MSTNVSRARREVGPRAHRGKTIRAPPRLVAPAVAIALGLAAILMTPGSAGAAESYFGEQGFLYRPGRVALRVGGGVQGTWLRDVGGLVGPGLKIAMGSSVIAGIVEVRLWGGGRPGTVLVEPAVGVGLLPTPGFPVPISFQMLVGLAPSVVWKEGALSTAPVLTLRPSVGVWFFPRGVHWLTLHLDVGAFGVPALRSRTIGVWGSVGVLFQLPVGRVEDRLAPL